MSRDEAEHIRQEIIRGMMLDGMTREEAEKAERARFARAFRKLWK